VPQHEPGKGGSENIHSKWYRNMTHLHLFRLNAHADARQHFVDSTSFE